ncbi:MAG: hypothetical protein AB7O98_16805 [Hyphomonadaceae bacterium]
MRTLLAAAAVCLALSTPAAAQTQTPPPPPACESAAHRALDFWIGEWDAHRADTNQLVGRSSIRSEDAGCVITEHWVSVNAPYSGHSLNILNRESGQWEQFWVDSTGNRTHFIGGPVDNGMQITTAAPVPVPGNPPQYMRVTLTRGEDGTVIQRGQSSPDATTWTTQYLFIYRPRPE